MTSDTSLRLHVVERKVLSEIISNGALSFEDIARRTGLDVGAVAKAAQWLSSKGLADIEERTSARYARLGREGNIYASRGLPERRLINALRVAGGSAGLDSLKELSELSEHEFRIAVIWAKRNGWIEIERDGETRIRLLDFPEKTEEELVLEFLRERRLQLSDLGPYVAAAERLAKRPGVVEISEERVHILSPTSRALSIPRDSLEVGEEVSQLTPEILVSGKWRDVVLSKYDVYAPVKPALAARWNPLSSLIAIVKRTFVEMGFEEIRGPLVELAFWNFDVLFQPQDHPAREMHDTFYLTSPSRGEVPRELASRVGRVHRDGGDTGSTGWGYRWSIEEACKLVLRTHTTATTIRHLAEHREPPVKVFSIDRVYRNERVDWKHLAELHQIEGILMDKDVSLRSLMGIIKEFYARLGIREVRFRPSYFPYTEPSAEVEVYLEDLKAWAELGGMGIFRPEVTLPLGVKYPVLAWGLGLERLAMALFGLEDIRVLYSNDLAWIRQVSPMRLLKLTRR